MLGRTCCATVIIQLSQQVLSPVGLARQDLSLSCPKYPLQLPGEQADCAYSLACSPCWALNKLASVPGLESCHQHWGLQQCSTLVFLLFHPSQEELLVSMPGLVLVLALLWLNALL